MAKIRSKRLAGMVLATIVAMLCISPQANAVSNVRIVELTNAHRTAAGLTPLKWNGSLSQSAFLKAQDMCAKDYWAHDSPDGLTPWVFMNRAGYAYVTAGENLAKNFATDEAIIRGWMNSPSHRANILKPGFSEMGVATTKCTLQGTMSTLVVAHYGSTSVRATPRAAPKPVTTPTAPVQPKPRASTVPTVTTKQATPQPTTVTSSPVPTSNPTSRTLSAISRFLLRSQLICTETGSDSSLAQPVNISNCQVSFGPYKTFFL